MSPRAVAEVRAVWGASLLLAPRRTLCAAQIAPRGPLVIAARVLGARHLAEAAAAVTRPRSRIARWSRWIDLTHAATMAPVAIARPALRPAATTSLVASAAFAVASAAAR